MSASGQDISPTRSTEDAHLTTSAQATDPPTMTQQDEDHAGLEHVEEQDYGDVEESDISAAPPTASRHARKRVRFTSGVDLSLTQDIPQLALQQLDPNRNYSSRLAADTGLYMLSALPLARIQQPATGNVVYDISSSSPEPSPAAGSSRPLRRQDDSLPVSWETITRQLAHLRVVFNTPSSPTEPLQPRPDPQPRQPLGMAPSTRARMQDPAVHGFTEDQLAGFRTPSPPSAIEHRKPFHPSEDADLPAPNGQLAGLSFNLTGGLTFRRKGGAALLD